MRAHRGSISPAAAFDALAPTWDRHHGPGSARAQEFADRVAYLRAVCRRRRVARALEIGCGTGCNLVALADVLLQGTGIDVAPAMIRQARSNAAAAGHLRFVTADAMQFVPATLGRFDAVLFLGALEHMPCARAALEQAAAGMVPDGCVIVVMPHPWHAGRPPRVHGRPIPTRLLSPRQLDHAAWQAGLRLRRLTGLGPAAPQRRRPAHDRPLRTALPPGAGGSLCAARHVAYAGELTRADAHRRQD